MILKALKPTVFEAPSVFSCTSEDSTVSLKRVFCMKNRVANISPNTVYVRNRVSITKRDRRCTPVMVVRCLIANGFEKEAALPHPPPVTSGWISCDILACPSNTYLRNNTRRFAISDCNKYLRSERRRPVSAVWICSSSMQLVWSVEWLPGSSKYEVQPPQVSFWEEIWELVFENLQKTI